MPKLFRYSKFLQLSIALTQYRQKIQVGFKKIYSFSSIPSSVPKNFLFTPQLKFNLVLEVEDIEIDKAQKYGKVRETPLG